MAEAADRITAGAGGRLPVLVAEDELGRLGTRFNALLDRLDEALARQRRFLADAAHELRTPIARARGLGELALDAPAGPEDREALRQTQRELQGMGHLVGELLALARLEADARGIGMESLYLDDIVAEVARGFTPLAQRRRQRLEVDLAEEIPLRGDAVSLTRMIGVLVDNALRYSPDGGVVRMRAVREATGAQVIVEDEGIGIPSEERGRLFERFFRGTRARTAEPDGSGLGLAIAQSIARSHGATITFDADRAIGTRVTVRFPS
jgi:two-component system OmpR family sensor kinase